VCPTPVTALWRKDGLAIKVIDHAQPIADKMIKVIDHAQPIADKMIEVIDHGERIADCSTCGSVR
jgi:hypothetical protein